MTRDNGRMWQRLQSALLGVALVALWEGSCHYFNISPVIIPAPSSVVMRLIDLVQTGTITPHLITTFTEIVTGFGLGAVTGLLVGTIISLVPVLDRLVYPYIVAFQTVPKIAIAPLFIIWFGYGIASKVVITALVCFFPMLVSVVAGFQSTDRDQVDMMHAFGATRWQTLVRLRLPSALVLIFAGLEISSVMAVIGAIVGEFVGAQQGLGYLITALNFNLDVAGVFAVLIFLSLIGIALHTIVKMAARYFVFWTRREQAPIIT